MSIVFLSFSPCFSQGTNKPAGNIDDLIQTEFPDSDLPDDWDTRPPEVGKIRLMAEIYLSDAKKEIQGNLSTVPDGIEGKDSVLYGKITQWLQEVDQVLVSKTRTDLLGLCKTTAEIISLGKNASAHNFSAPLVDLIAYVQGTARVLVYNTADFCKENANPAIAQHDAMLACFYCPALIEESDWEDEPLPLDAAGAFIVNADNAAAKLKTKTLEEIETFLNGSTDNSFFERYEAEGNGMDILKTKYAANKVAIQAKFAEVLAYAAQLESQ